VGQDSARACYGAKHVEVAHERLAVQTLLIADSLFRFVRYSLRLFMISLGICDIM
jgi:stalled ribosome rescue protein Dom34